MMNAARSIQVAYSLLLIAGILGGCKKDGDPASWDVDILAPLVTTTFTIGDIVPDSLLSVDGAGNVTLLYTSELFSVDLDTLLKAPDTTYTYPGAITVPGPLNFPPGTGIVSENNVTRFDFNDVALRELFIREGTVELELTNMIASNVIGTFSLPGAQFPGGGNSLSATVAAGTPAAPVVVREVRDLAGVSFDLRGPDLNAVNTLHTIIGINLDPNGQGATVTDQDSVNARITYRGLKPEYARGYFGSEVYTVEPTDTELGLFDNFVSGTLDLDQVALRMKLVNGIGIDLQVVLGYLRAVNTRTGNTVDLSNAIFQGPINLTRATDLGNGFTPTIYTSLLDNSNSNVDLFLENLPDKVSYALDLRLNPLGDISNGNDFVYANSEVRAELELEVPLRLIASQLTLQTFVDVDLPRGFQAGDLRFFTTNGFPFSANLVAEVVDENDQPISSLAIDGSIASALLGTNGLVQTSVDSRLQASLNRDQAELLKEGGRLRLRVEFNTADQSQHLQILDSYKLDLQVTLGANYMVNGE
jgi:hypothetical protein